MRQILSVGAQIVPTPQKIVRTLRKNHDAEPNPGTFWFDLE